MGRGPTGAKLDGGITPMPAYRLTKPTNGRRKWVICNSQCDTCPLYQNGCAGNCNRFPTDVCADCPCRASMFVGKVNEAPESPLLIKLDEKKSLMEAQDNGK